MGAGAGPAEGQYSAWSARAAAGAAAGGDTRLTGPRSHYCSRPITVG